MNLRDFLVYRNMCPLCDNTLSMTFNSRKQQKHRYEDGRLLISLFIPSIDKNQKSYYVGYSFGLDDNSFFIEFYRKNSKKIEYIPVSLLKRFVSFNANTGMYKIYKFCNHCKSYQYSSNYFKINLTEPLKLPDLTISSESFDLSTHITDGYDGYRLFKLVNNYITNKSILNFGTERYKDDIKTSVYIPNFNTIETSLIKFVSKSETIARINKLLTFY